eukprot:7283627-Alexandrium_andersonii.AAC.1
MGLLSKAGKKAIAEAFKPHHFAIGVAGGAEAMAKDTQALANTEGFAAAKLDGTSAFNSQNKATALQHLAKVSPGLANA